MTDPVQLELDLKLVEKADKKKSRTKKELETQLEALEAEIAEMAKEAKGVSKWQKM